MQKLVLDALDEIKAVDPVVLDVRGKTGITDLMVVVSGNSNRHVKAIADTVVEHMKRKGLRPLGVEGEEAGEIISFGEEIVKNDTNKWRFMNIINQNFTVDEKMIFLEQIWRIILSDGRIDKYEDHVARRISTVLRIPHHRMIEAKVNAMKGADI